MDDLRQKRTAVVTGGAQGIGLAVVQRLLDAGHDVQIWDVAPGSDAAYAAAVQRGAALRHVDVTDLDMTQAAADELSRIDILVTSAGIAGPNASTWTYPAAEWSRVLAINLTGTWHCARAVVPKMIARNHGRIVMVASIAGKEGNPNASAYSASKAGVIALTKSLGKELAGYDISVNCVTPSAARTRIFEQMSEEHIAYMLSKIPRGRFVRVEEVASMIAWLTSLENSFSTGAVFDISGGRATY